VWVTHTVHVHGFGSLPSEQDEFVDSPEFMLLGNPWRLRVYPGGSAGEKEGRVSIGLWNHSDKAIEIHYGFSINDEDGKQVAYRISYDRLDDPDRFAPMGGDSDYWEISNFAKRSDLLNSLVNGTLIIQVRIRSANPTTSVPPPFIPKNPLTKMIQEEFLEEKYSDIMFEVGGDQRKVNAKKVAKTTPFTFPAHRVIVAKFSNTLAELCASGGGDNGTNPIEIDNVSPDIFRLLLSYMYGMTISNNNMKSHAKEIIDVADRFGVTSLKLEAEASLVNTTTLSVENVKDLLIYADSKNCALLKEVAMDYMLEHSDVVLQNIRFDDAPGSLVSDVFAAIALAKMRKDGRGATDANENSASHFHSMRISELRQRVHVDGSREMLIASLEKASTELNSLDEELEEEL
jgi:hypothetical protein